MWCVWGFWQSPDLKTGPVQVDRNRAARCNELEAPTARMSEQSVNQMAWGSLGERGSGRYPRYPCIFRGRGVGWDNVII